MMIKTMTSEVGCSTRARLPGTLKAGSCAAVFVFSLLAAGSANALNGVGASEASNYARGNCQNLRSTAGRVDAVVACFRGATDCSRDGGGAIGYCEDGVFGGVPPSVFGNAVWEANTQILASSFGGVFSLEKPGNVGAWCQSYPPPPAEGGGGGGGPKKAQLPPPGRKACVTFQPESSAPPDDLAHILPVVENQPVCDTVAAAIRTSVNPNAEPLFVALISVALTQETQPTELVACGDDVGWTRTGARGALAAGYMGDLLIGDTPWLYGNTGSKK